MIGTVHKIHPAKMSRNGNSYQRIEFILENGKWAKTDVCSTYGNHFRWIPISKSGVGTIVDGLVERKPGEVNADSFPKIIKKEENEKNTG